MSELEERFWAKVDKTGDCWVWTGCRFRTGYGSFSANRRTNLAHRIAYELTFGPIPTGDGYHGLCVLHRCDNPPCVRPDHLFVGTHADNMHDMASKGRHAVQNGENNSSAKLTALQVIEIRQRYSAGGISQRALAREYGVKQPGLAELLTRKTWKHL